MGMLFLFFFCIPTHAETLHLATEHYPPFSMRQNGEPVGEPDDVLMGISPEIIRELFRRAGIQHTIQIYPWKRACGMALRKLKHGVFSTTRTPERESLFKWAGPLGANEWVLMAKKSRNIRIRSLEDARRYEIGVYGGDAMAGFLEKKGFKLQYTSHDYLNALKLNLGRTDLWATGSLLDPYLAKKQGVSELEQVLVFKQVSLFIAFNPSVPDKTIDRLNKIFREMKADGSMDKIFNRCR